MKYLIITLLAYTGVSYAGEHHNPPPKAVSQHQEAEASAKSSSNSSSKASSNAEGGAGGAATSNATGGAGGDAQATGGNAQGGTSAASLVNEQPRQVPATAQGSFAISGCQVAGNAGGANSHGAGFLGFGFTPDECYRFMLAQAYEAIGQVEAACEVLNRTDMALNLERGRGFTVPNCKPRDVAAPVSATPAPVALVPVVVPDTVTHKELDETAKRIVDKVTQK